MLSLGFSISFFSSSSEILQMSFEFGEKTEWRGDWDLIVTCLGSCVPFLGQPHGSDKEGLSCSATPSSGHCHLTVPSSTPRSEKTGGALPSLSSNVRDIVTLGPHNHSVKYAEQGLWFPF